MHELLNQHKFQHNLDNYISATLEGDDWLIPGVASACRLNPTLQFKTYTVDSVIQSVVSVIRSLDEFGVGDDNCNGIKNSTDCLNTNCTKLFGVGGSGDTFNNCIWDNQHMSCCCSNTGLCPASAPTPPTPYNDKAITNLINYCNIKGFPTPDKVFLLQSKGIPETCQDTTTPPELLCTHFYTWDNFAKAVELYNKYAIPYDDICWGGTGGGFDPGTCPKLKTVDKCTKEGACIWGKWYDGPCGCFDRVDKAQSTFTACSTPKPAPTPPTPPPLRKRLFLKEGEKEGENITNLKIISAFLANVFRETGGYGACKERLTSPNGCPYGLSSCDSGKASDYKTNPKLCGGCPASSTTYESCPIWQRNVKCTDHWGNKHAGENCWFGRGAVQLSYFQNYGRVANLLQYIPLNEVGISTSTNSFRDYLMENPDAICNNGIIAFLTSIAYFSTQQAGTTKGENCPKWQTGEILLDGSELASICVGGGGAGDAPCRGHIYNYILRDKYKIDIPKITPISCNLANKTGCCLPEQYFNSLVS